jgi:hypothetical protein
MIQDIDPLEKPRYSTEELVNLVTEKKGRQKAGRSQKRYY